MKLIQVFPHWNKHSLSPSEIEASLNVTSQRQGADRFEFKGPGLYLSDTDTLLIIPCDNQLTTDLVWSKSQPKNMTFNVFVWNAPVSETIVGMGYIPTRVDNRS